MPGRRARGALAAVVLGCILAAVLLPGPAAGQTPPGWSGPVNLSNTDTPSSYPALAVDAGGTAHVIWSEQSGANEGAILYTHLEGSSWSNPVDILVTPDGGLPKRPRMMADSRDYLHVIWIDQASIFYSRAYAPAAGSAHGWSEPQGLVLPDSNIVYADLAIDTTGDLYVTYAKQIGDDSGIYVVVSLDGGFTWGNSLPVFQNLRSERAVDKSRAAVGGGILHVVWVEYEYPETFPPIGIRYAQSPDAGATWSAPIDIANGPYDDPGIALRAGGEVHIVWSGTAEDRFRFHRWSADGGRRWSEVWRNPEVGGLLGWPALAVDGSQNLHWLQAVDLLGIGDALYYNVWINKEWSPGIVLLRDTVLAQNPTNVSAAVALGNELHMVVQFPLDTVDGGWQYDIVYLHRHLDTVGSTVRPLATVTPMFKPSPTPTSSPTPPASADPTPTATVTPMPAATPQPTTLAAPHNLDQTTIIAAGLLPAVLLVGGIVALALCRRRRSRRAR